MKKLLMVAVLSTFCSATFAADEWVSLFDGKTFGDWKVNENKDSWKIEDGRVCLQWRSQPPVLHGRHGPL